MDASFTTPAEYNVPIGGKVKKKKKNKINVPSKKELLVADERTIGTTRIFFYAVAVILIIFGIVAYVAKPDKKNQSYGDAFYQTAGIVGFGALVALIIGTGVGFASIYVMHQKTKEKQLEKQLHNK